MTSKIESPRRFIISIPPITIEADDESEAREKFIKKVGYQYTRFIKVIDYTCKECGHYGDMHSAECSKAMVL